MDTKRLPMTGGPVVGLQKGLPTAQGKMKITWEKIPYEQGVGSLDKPGRWTGGGKANLGENKHLQKILSRLSHTEAGPCLCVMSGG